MAPTIAKPLLSDLVAQTGQVPSSHVRPFGDRPDLSNVDNESGAGIPLIDLNGPERRKVVEAIGRACESDGFFMVTNHGIPEEVVEAMLRVAREFFHLPEPERLKCYSDDPKKAIRLSTSFNVRTEKVNNWRDFLRLRCYPLESFIDQWPSNPPSFSSTDLTASYAGEEVLMMQGGEEGRTVGQRSAGDHNAGNVFIVDSGASAHATGNQSLFTHLNALPQPADPTTAARNFLRVANGSVLPIRGYGTVSYRDITIDGVLFVPGLAKNIVSVSKLGELDYIVEFTRTICFIRQAGTGDLVGKGRLVGGLFEIDFLQARRS